MKKTLSPRTRSAATDLRPEYDFDYTQARPNRFAARVNKECLVVTLDRDVSRVFTTPQSVNATLRALILPRARRRKRHAK
jgi:hypothetical protein